MDQYFELESEDPSSAHVEQNKIDSATKHVTKSSYALDLWLKSDKIFLYRQLSLENQAICTCSRFGLNWFKENKESFGQNIFFLN